MNIAYLGTFLREGLLELGHKLVEIPKIPNQSINDAINAIHEPFDFVLLELYGSAIP